MYGLFFTSCGAFFTHLLLVDRFRCERHLRDDVLLFGIAGEGVVFCGDLNAVEGLDIAIIVFDMQAVGVHRSAVDMIICAAVMPIENEAVFGIMRELCAAEMLKAPAAGHRIDIYGVFEMIFPAFDFGANLFALPSKPIGDVRKFGHTILSRK